MDLTELSQEGWSILNKKFHESIPGYGSHLFKHFRLDFNRVWDLHTQGIHVDPKEPIRLLNQLRSWFYVPFSDLPLMMGVAISWEKVVIAFRMEIGK